MKCIVENCYSIAIRGSQLCQQHSDRSREYASAFRAADDASDQNIIPDALSASDFSSSTDDFSSADTSTSTSDFGGVDGGDSGGGGAGGDF
jgi:hypothetical protein